MTDQDESLRTDAVLHDGCLEGESVPDLLHRLAEARATGVLRLERDGAGRTLYIEAGRIVFASSEDPNDRLGEILLRSGRIGIEDLEAAVACLGRGKRLGTILVERGALTPDDLVQGVIGQVRAIALSLFAWERGRFRFTAGALSSEEVITLNLPTAELILEGIREIRDWDRVRRAVGPPRALFRRDDGPDRGAPDLRALGPVESSLLDQLATPTTVEELCGEVFASSFEVYRSLWALRVLGLIRPAARDYPAVAADAVPREGRIEEVGLARVLLDACRRGETGLLRAWCAEGERTVHLKDGTVVFATSSDPNDSLVSYLLNRGVIGVKDRDRAVRRLLSRKRVGTLLVEGGALSSTELEDYVRGQVAEILQGLFAWPGGEYAFEEGELPTLEEITLEQSVETLVLNGILRVSQWARVREGVGGQDSTFRLRADYLDVLDRMEIGPSEWEIISLLKTELDVTEICRRSPLPDFRTAQVLWALRLVGVIERVSAEELRRREEQAERERAEQEALAEVVPEAVAGPAQGAEPPEEPAIALASSDDAPSDAGSEDEADVLDGLEMTASALAPLSDDALPDAGLEDEADALDALEEPAFAFESSFEEAPLDDGPDSEDGIFEATDEPEEASEILEIEPAAEPAAAPASEGVPELAATMRFEPPARQGGNGDAEDEPFSAVSGEEPASPEDPLEREIQRFNEKHRYLFDHLRAEIGAGARNFVVTCQRRGGDALAMFEGLRVGPEGEYDARALRQSIFDRNIEDYPVVFEALLDTEFGMVKDLLPPDQLDRIETGLREIDLRYTS